MKILFYRYGSICEPDVIEGFLELGHQVSEITEEITNKTLLPSQTIRLISEYLGNDPHDLVFTINFYPGNFRSLYTVKNTLYLLDCRFPSFRTIYDICHKSV